MGQGFWELRKNALGVEKILILEGKYDSVPCKCPTYSRSVPELWLLWIPGLYKKRVLLI